MPVELDTKRKALEQIRYADRLIGSAIGSLQRLTRQQRFDVFGVDTDGYFAEHDRGDNASIASLVLEAQHAFEAALNLLGTSSTEPPVELTRWGLAEGVLDGVFDLLALARAKKNLSRANELHARFVEVFEVIRQSDPALADVAPLIDWKLTFKEVVVGALGYHSPYAIAAVVAAGLGYVLLAIYY